MRGWKFWEKSEDTAPPDVAPAEPPRRFSARPRTDTLPPTASDPAAASKLAGLVKRREAVRFDVERAQQANDPDNPWLDRVRLLDEALAAAFADRERIASHREPAGALLPPSPIGDVSVDAGPPPRVSFRIGEERFSYEEELDWAERGFQIARGELIRRTGDCAHLVPPALLEAHGSDLTDHLDQSLFAFASDLRDRALAGAGLPDSPTLSDLAKPDVEDGGWLDWSGHSARRAEREARLAAIDAEIERLSAERARELQEMERWADRLPIALRRLADVDAEIAALGG